MLIVLFLQACTAVLNVLQSGELNASEETVEAYRSKCQALFPLAAAFRPPSAPDNLIEESAAQD